MLNLGRGFFFVFTGLIFANHAFAATVTFDGITSGATSFNYDADDDGTDDAVFTDVSNTGFVIDGPGPNQLFIDEPGLTNSIIAGPEVRVDFPFGVQGTLGTAFALNQSCTVVGSVDSSLTGTLSVFDAEDTLLGTATAEAVCTETPTPPSSFVEAEVSTSFSGTGTYATIDFNDASIASAYIVDNFTGFFGSVEVGEQQTPAQIPALPFFGLVLLGSLLALLGTRKLSQA